MPFSKWTTEQVCGWMEDCGLGQYVNLARQWVVSGQTLLSATPQELEKVSHVCPNLLMSYVEKFLFTDPECS